MEESIYNYIDKMFDVDNINWSYPYEYDDETGEEGEDDNRIEFYVGDYEDEDVCFRWTNCEYFNKDSPAQDICPELAVESPYSGILDGYFGDLWHLPFMKWFTEKFDLPVKTVATW